ncbi:MAG: VOC family protein [Planctomycetota bacterium]
MGLSIHETVLYATEPAVVAAFYERVLGLRQLPGADDESAGLRMPDGDAVLLVFSPERAREEGRGVPTHGAMGPGHVAFRVRPGSLDEWRRRLAESGVEIELERGWSRGGRSLYFRDPAGNSAELVEGHVWPDAP